MCRDSITKRLVLLKGISSRYIFAIFHTHDLLIIPKASKVPHSKVHEANMGPPGSCRPQMGPMLAPRTLLSGVFCSTEKWSSGLMMVSAANDVNLYVHIYIRVSSHEHWNISSHRSHDFLLKSVVRVTTKKTETRKAMRHLTGIYVGNLPVTGGFSTQRPNNKQCFHVLNLSWFFLFA